MISRRGSFKSVGGARHTVALAAVLGATSLARAAEPELEGFPARVGKPGSAGGVTVADLQRDGRQEIIVVSGEGVAVMDASGKILSGFPAVVRNTADPMQLMFEAPPTVCDLDGDGTGEIIVAGSDRRLYALSAFGRMAAGFPVGLDGVARGAVACVGTSGTKRSELALATDAGSLLLVPGTGGEGKRLARIGKGAESGVAVADLDGDGAMELVVVGGDAGLYVVDRKGKTRRGFPYKMAFRSTGVPAIGDINDDGSPEILVGSQDFKVHAVDLAGRVLAGFPVVTEYRIYAGVALGDLNGDGALDGVVGSADGKVYAFDGRGQALAGFPATQDGRIVSDAAIADLDRDGTPEIALTTQAGTLALVDAGGRPVTPFPVRLGGKGVIAPAIADLNGDGLGELIAQTSDGHLHAYRFAARGDAGEAVIGWSMAGHDAGHTGRYAPNPGRFKDLGFSLKRVRTTDALKVSYRYFDLDGDAERDTQIRWYVDDVAVPELNNAREVPSVRTRKHQRWSYSLQDGVNFRAYGERDRLSRVFRSGPIEVENTQATPPAISLLPAAPSTLAPLSASVTGPSSDADGDSIEYRYLWLRDGVPVDAVRGRTQVEAAHTRKHEEWRVVVVPFDGEQEGEHATAAVRILNTPPSAPELAVQPELVRVTGPARIVVRVPARDDDGDPVTYSYAYRVNGATLSVPAATAELAGPAMRKHDRVAVTVTAHDDEAAGGSSTIEVVVGNTPPPAPAVTIVPAAPTTTSALRLAVVRQEADADGDPVALQHRWLRDGTPVDFPVEVPASATLKGQRWQLEVTPYDGESTGPTVRAETRILNSVPTPPTIVLDRYRVTTDEAVVPRIIEPASDDDGDTLRLKYQWTRNDAVVRFGDSKVSLLPNEAKKGERWQVAVRAHDGDVDSEPAVLRFEVVNSPPTAPEIVLSTQRPTVNQPVAVQVAKPASDKDGDALVYRHRWVRNGVAVSEWAATKTTLVVGDMRKGEHWRVEVVAFDGEAEGPAALAELWVQDSVPSAPQIRIEPASPATTHALRCTKVRPASDLDGDALTYRTRWYRDGKPVELGADGDTVPAALTHKGETWTCDMQAFDGTKASELARAAAVKIGNSAPGAPALAIEPPRPTTDDDLDCRLRSVALDDDGDPVKYTYQWRVDGKPWAPAAGAEPSRVPAERTKRGQRWQCRVTASDGVVHSGASETVVVIGNSRPTAPRVRVEPPRPAPGMPLTCEIVESSKDADGDAVTYRYAWLRDGVEQPFAASSTQVPGRLVRARDMWRCRVVATDNTDAAAPGESLDVVVGVTEPSVSKRATPR